MYLPAESVQEYPTGVSVERKERERESVAEADDINFVKMCSSCDVGRRSE